MNYTFFRVLILLILCTLTGISCENNTLSFSTSSSTTGGGGVYQSKDRGDTWEQKVFVSQVKKKTNTIVSVNVSSFVADPTDSRVMYLITRESGLWKTEDAGGVWTQSYRGGGLRTLVVHPQDTSVLYLVAGNTVQKSTNGGNTWEQIYLEPRQGVGVSAMLVDALDPRHLVCATSAGDILESRDSGIGWQVIFRFDSPVVSLLQPGKLNMYFAATPSYGVWRSSDEGKTWTDVTERMKEFPGGREFRALVPDTATPRALLLATAYGLFRTKDFGGTWDTIPLIARPGGVEILSLAVNPKNSSQLYYSVPGALYRSLNGGGRWTTIPLPSSLLPTALLADHFNQNILYMGFTKPKK